MRSLDWNETRWRPTGPAMDDWTPELLRQILYRARNAKNVVLHRKWGRSGDSVGGVRPCRAGIGASAHAATSHVPNGSVRMEMGRLWNARAARLYRRATIQSASARPCTRHQISGSSLRNARRSPCAADLPTGPGRHGQAGGRAAFRWPGVNDVTAWDAISSVVTVIAASVAALLAVACAWPDSERRRRPVRDPTRGAQVVWPAHWSCELPGRPLTLAEAHRAMQLHREHDCARKRVALAMLVAEGRITPDSSRHYRQWA